MNPTIKKVLFNFSGTVLPMGIGLVLIPLLLERLGNEKFGLLSIGWMIVGYFGILDMGIGRSLTQKLSQNAGKNDYSAVNYLIKNSTLIVGALGLLGMIAMWTSSNYIIDDIIKINNDIKSETLIGFHWLSITIPIVLISTALFGALEGLHLFEISSLIRAPLNILMFAAPALITNFTSDIGDVFLSLLIVRILILITLIIALKNQVHQYGYTEKSSEDLKSIFKSGGWITISNAVSPIMVYFDRFYISYALSLGMVAYYTTPLDFLTKTLLVPVSIMSVLFSNFARDWNISTIKVKKDYLVSLLVVFIIMLPIPTISIIFGEDILSIWLNNEFAKNSAPLLEVLSVGILFNGIAIVPYFMLQGIGRSDLPAKMHLIELPLYCFSLYQFVNELGLSGVAYAWSMRVILDFLLQSICAIIIFNKNNIR
jgi:O-antigen/teichoic acid export membrane protein